MQTVGRFIDVCRDIGPDDEELLRNYATTTWRELFAQEPPAGADVDLLVVAVCYELQFREADEKASEISATVLARRERALTLDLDQWTEDMPRGLFPRPQRVARVAAQEGT